MKESPYEILNFVELISHYLGKTPVSFALHRYETIIFNILVIALVSLVFFLVSRRSPQVPGRLQTACEAIVEGLDNFVCGILGPQGKKYTPFLGTLFLYIWAMNLIGLVPLMKAPTSTSLIMKIGLITIPVPTVTAALAIIVFCYVQWTGIKEQGIIVPITLLCLLVLSVLMMGYTLLLAPLQLFFERQIREGFVLFVRTFAAFACITATVVLILILISYRY